MVCYPDRFCTHLADTSPRRHIIHSICALTLGLLRRFQKPRGEGSLECRRICRPYRVRPPLLSTYVAYSSPRQTMLAFGHISDRIQVLSLHRCSTSNHRTHADISTAYVDQLHSYSSPSTFIAPTPRDESADLERAPATPKLTNTEHSHSERTPLTETTDSVHHDLGLSYGAIHHHNHTHDYVDSNASTFF